MIYAFFFWTKLRREQKAVKLFSTKGYSRSETFSSKWWILQVILSLLTHKRSLQNYSVLCPLSWLNLDSSCNGQRPSVASDFDIPKTFENAFTDSKQLEKIPRLDRLPATGLKSGTLVRFLGMVQDTSFSQEIYVGMTKVQDVTIPEY